MTSPSDVEPPGGEAGSADERAPTTPSDPTTPSPPTAPSTPTAPSDQTTPSAQTPPSTPTAPSGQSRSEPADGPEAVGERRFRKLVDRSSDLLVVLGTDERVQWVSPSIKPMLGFDPEAVVGMRSEALLHRDDIRRARAQLEYTKATGSSAEELVVRAVDADGVWHHLRLTSADLREDPDIGGIVYNVADVTKEVEAQMGRDRLSAALEQSPDLVFTVTRSTRHVWMNGAGKTMLGLPGPEADIDTIVSRTPPWVRHRISTEVLESVTAQGLWEGELALFDLEGEEVPLSVVMVALEEHGELDTVTVIARDISERKAFEDQLEHQATHDPLTGLPNRTLLLDRLRVALGRAERHRTLAAVLFLDLDNFKLVNDSLGHSSGDRLLREVSRRIEDAVRPGDTVARFGGDEFAVLCEDLRDRDEAVIIATRIGESVARPVEIDGTEVAGTVSIGVATTDGGQDAETLMRDSDAAMYQAKARGRSRTEVFDAAMHVQATDRLELETGLRRSLERHEMRLVYQPQVDLATGRVNGVECLVRWEHPERGVLAPGDFLPIAEETGLIVPIGGWILTTASRALARMRDLVPEIADSLVMSVNISARQLASPRLIDDVEAIVAASELPAGAMMVEITETDLMDVDASGEALMALQQLGVRVAVDDFGTGWSSLRYLRHFPVDVLKIDRSFVSGLGRDQEDEAIVAAVIDLAHALGLSAVAEGVEEELHLQRLRALGCDSAQGWLLGMPMPEGDLIDVLVAQVEEAGLRPAPDDEGVPVD